MNALSLLQARFSQKQIDLWTPSLDQSFGKFGLKINGRVSSTLCHNKNLRLRTELYDLDSYIILEFKGDNCCQLWLRWDTERECLLLCWGKYFGAWQGFICDQDLADDLLTGFVSFVREKSSPTDQDQNMKIIQQAVFDVKSWFNNV